MTKTINFTDQRAIEKIQQMAKKNKASSYIQNLILKDIGIIGSDSITRDEVIKMIFEYSSNLSKNKAAPTKDIVPSKLINSMNSILNMD